MYLPNLTSVALPVPEKIGESLDTPTVPFLENFLWDFVRMDPVNVST